MRIAIGGFMHESNTFASAPTDLSKFREASLTYGPALVPVWREAHHEMGGFIAGAERFGYDIVPIAMAWGTPAGPVADEFFEHMVDALVTGIRLAEPDGVLLALHGAMVTPRHADADAEVLRRLRAAVGTKLPIAVTLDFHGNISPQMAETANILVGYQTYPHIDQRDCGLLAAELLSRTIQGEIRPESFVAKPPMLINLLGQATDRPPMTDLLKFARQEEHQPGMLSISVMAGFAYADVPEMGASIMAVADGDRALAERKAKEIAEQMWAVREQLNVEPPQSAEAVRKAIAAQKPPVVLVDIGDNIGGGSAGDGTVLLAELLKQKAKGFVVVLYSPEAVKKAKAVGIGGTLEAAVGGAIDRMHGEPVKVRGTVRLLHDGHWIETEARHGGKRQNNQGHTAVLDLGDGNALVVNSLRTPPFSLGQLTSLGIDPKESRILVVKAAVAYKAAYAPIAGEIIEVDTPGLTAINPARFEYHRIRRPLYPLE
ncbi:MAG TPA: M81 family metallopeptidase [Gemmataceae bacterium]|jgi:microcystin degradation protein MlrC